MSVTIPRTQSVRPGYGHWRPSLKYLLKKPRSDRPWYDHWRFGQKRLLKKTGKNPVCGTVVWPLADRVKNLIEKNDPVCQTAVWPLAWEMCVIVARDLPPWHTKNVFTFHSHYRVRVKQCAWNLHQSCLTSRSTCLKKKKKKKTSAKTNN